MKTTATILFLLLGTFAFGQSKEKYKSIGDSLLAIGQHAEAIKYFEEKSKQSPKNEDALRALGHAHIAANNLELGEKYYREALVANSKCGRYYLNIGVIFSLRGDNTKALEYFDEAVSLDSNDAALYSNRARLKET